MKRAATFTLSLAVVLAGFTFTGCDRNDETAASADPQLDGVLPKTAPDMSIFEDQAKIYAKVTPAPPPPAVPATTTAPATEAAPGETPAPAAPVAPAAPAGDSATPPPPPPG